MLPPSQLISQAKPFARPKREAVRLRAAALILLLGSLFGCSQGGYLPGGPHALPAGQLSALINTAARTYGVKPNLVAAVIDAESGGDPAAISRAGAMGLMQLMPGTSSQYGVSNPFDPQANVAGGVRYLHDLLHRYHGNVSYALAAYNAGPGFVDAVHGIPAIPETRSYVARITAAIR
jgi:soluble lytic murein transglycosylase-like protein